MLCCCVAGQDAAADSTAQPVGESSKPPQRKLQRLVSFTGAGPLEGSMKMTGPLDGIAILEASSSFNTSDTNTVPTVSNAVCSTVDSSQCTAAATGPDSSTAMTLYWRNYGDSPRTKHRLAMQSTASDACQQPSDEPGALNDMPAAYALADNMKDRLVRADPATHQTGAATASQPRPIPIARDATWQGATANGSARGSSGELSSTRGSTAGLSTSYGSSPSLNHKPPLAAGKACRSKPCRVPMLKSIGRWSHTKHAKHGSTHYNESAQMVADPPSRQQESPSSPPPSTSRHSLEVACVAHSKAGQAVRFEAGMAGMMHEERSNSLQTVSAPLTTHERLHSGQVEDCMVSTLVSSAEVDQGTVSSPLADGGCATYGGVNGAVSGGRLKVKANGLLSAAECCDGAGAASDGDDQGSSSTGGSFYGFGANELQASFVAEVFAVLQVRCGSGDGAVVA